MPWMIAGAALGGSLLSADAAGNAADTQAAATDRANALTEKQYQQTRSDLAPWRTNGEAANNALARKLGIGGPGASVDQNDPLWQSIVSDYQQKHREKYGTDPTTDFTAGPDERALYDHMVALYQQNKGPQQQPADYGSLLKPFTGADLQNEPGYQFGLQQGNTALDRSLQRGGMMFSGAALKGAQRFGQDYAGTKYGDAFNRDASTKRQQYDFLSGQSSSGQNAATMTANAGTAMAGTIGSNTTALGNAAGAAQIAQGNSLNSGLTNAANGYQQNELLNKIMGGNAGFGGAQGRLSQTGLGSSGFGTGLAYGNQDFGQYI